MMGVLVVWEWGVVISFSNFYSFVFRMTFTMCGETLPMISLGLPMLTLFVVVVVVVIFLNLTLLTHYHFPPFTVFAPLYPPPILLCLFGEVPLEF